MKSMLACSFVWVSYQLMMFARYGSYEYIRWSMNRLFIVIVYVVAYCYQYMITYICIMTVDKCLGHVKTKHLSRASSSEWRVTESHALGAWVWVPYLWSMGKSVHRRMYTQHYRYKCKLYRHRHRTVDHPASHSYDLFIVNNHVHMLQSITVNQCILRFMCLLSLLAHPCFDMFLGTYRGNDMHGGK